MNRRVVLKASTLLPLSWVGCGSESSESTERPTFATDFTLIVGDAIQFNLRQMRVETGAEITVTIRHTGQMPAASMGHNFVLLQQGVDLVAFANDAGQASDRGYIPEAREGEVIAHTDVVGGGESDSVTFTAPAPGTYKYICSFPGHFVQMQGDFIVS